MRLPIQNKLKSYEQECNLFWQEFFPPVGLRMAGKTNKSCFPLSRTLLPNCTVMLLIFAFHLKTQMTKANERNLTVYFLITECMPYQYYNHKSKVVSLP